jgi:hypothetical protein
MILISMPYKQIYSSQLSDLPIINYPSRLNCHLDLAHSTIHTLSFLPLWCNVLKVYMYIKFEVNLHVTLKVTNRPQQKGKT